MANPPSNRGNREGIAPKIRKSTPLYCTSLSPSLHFFPQIFWFFWPKKKNSTVLKGTNTAQASMRTRLLLGNKSCPATKNWFNAQNGKEYGWRRCAALRTMYVKVNAGTKDSQSCHQKITALDILIAYPSLEAPTQTCTAPMPHLRATAK